MLTARNLETGSHGALIPEVIVASLSDNERDWLQKAFEASGGRFPSLDELWGLMDEQWKACQCDPCVADSRLDQFYSHPVWLLNGLFIEQDIESQGYRKQFVEWIAEQSPCRVADFGGGFGSLARSLAGVLPHAHIEIVEPYAHPAAKVLASEFRNINYVEKLTGNYDLIIATDVFEHVHDPIGLAAQTATFLPEGGHYLMANCFHPVILCHLPQLFHLSAGWDFSMRALGLSPGRSIQYGRVYTRQKNLDVERARHVGECARKIFSSVAWLPRGRAQVTKYLMHLLCK